MRQTLFLVPHEVLGLPVFGFGWALVLWAIASAGLMLWLIRRQGFNNDTRGYLPVLLLVAAAIVFVAPMMEIAGQSAGERGLPIRGYGVMMLLGVVAGVGLAAYRAQRMGLEPETIFSLGFVMFLAGIVGARLFFIVQYWEQYAENPLQVFNVTQGGLVVYGSVLGGVPAGAIYLYKHKLPVLAIGDLIAPSMLIGLAFGRIGCLMNGCCFGGVCEQDWAPRLEFPANTPPYVRQAQLGQLYGLRIGSNEDQHVAVKEVYAGKSVDAAPLEVGDRIDFIEIAGNRLVRAADRAPEFIGSTLTLETLEGEFVDVKIGKPNDDGRGQVGIRTEFDDQFEWHIAKVTPGSPAERAGLVAGQKLRTATLPPLANLARVSRMSEQKIAQRLLEFGVGRPIKIATSNGAEAQLPLVVKERSLPVHPTQVYSSFAAFLLFAFLWFYYPLRRRDGEVFALMLIIYPVVRILLEFIRVDEPGQFATIFTISQWISTMVIVAGFALIVFVHRQPLGSALPPEVGETTSELAVG